jgi:hypothetical protein
MSIPSEITRKVRVTQHQGGVANPGPDSSKKTSKSGTKIAENHVFPSAVERWDKFHVDLDCEIFDNVVGMLDKDLWMKMEVTRKPATEDEMVDNYFKALAALADVCTITGLSPFDVALERKVKLGEVESRPDVLIGRLEADISVFTPWLVCDAKAADKWPTMPKHFWAALTELWKVKALKTIYSAEQKPIVQFTTHLAASQLRCGILFNGFVAHFCKLDQHRALYAATPIDMSSAEFWTTLVKFINYARNQSPLVLLTLQAAATGAQDDDCDGMDDEEVDAVQVPGPGLGREYDWEGVQPLVSGGGDRAEVWILPAQGGGNVAVKAVEHAIDPDGSSRSELINEVKVYNALRERGGSQEFIAEFVASGKLPGGRRSGIVTKFAGQSIDKWPPGNNADLLEMYHKASSALKRLHESGFMHGDVAVRNFVMEKDTKKVRVIDLGRAYARDDESNPELEMAELKDDFERAFPGMFDSLM